MSAGTQAQWGSRLGFILASAGSAIGLGAIWKFPFWAGANGGGAFIIPYIFFTFTIGVALVMAEIAIGRQGRGSAFQALKKIGGKTFGVCGVIALLTAYFILSYYSVVGGWCVSYLVDSMTGSVATTDAALLQKEFGELVSNGWVNVGWHFVFLTLTCAVVLGGVEKGIERISKYLLPLLFVLMVVIIIRCLMLPGAWEGVVWLFHFSWAEVTPQAILNAMGFTFFSLSIGAGILITYGSYVSRDTSIPGASVWVAVLAIQAALLAGLMIIPAVFAFGLEPNGGPGLVFVTVPLIFAQIPMGDVFAFFFYICLLVAALTSSVSLLEVVVAWLVGSLHWDRKFAVFACWITLFLLGAVSALSFGEWSGFTIGGRNFFDLLDYVCTNFLMPFGGLVVALLMGWKARRVFAIALNIPKRLSAAKLHFVVLMVAYLAPIMVLVAMAQGVLG